MASPPADNLYRGDPENLADHRKRRDRIVLFVTYGLILLAVWTPLPWQRFISLAALAWVMIVTWLSFDGSREMGLRGPGFRRSLWVAGAALLLAAAAVLVANRMQTLHAPASPVLFVQRYWAYTIWSFLQEFLLLNFFLLRLLRLLPGKNAAVLVTTVLFTIAHLPNPILTVLTLLWGWASCKLFLHYRNLYTLAMAHAILGISIAITVPGPVDHNMRVGLGYLTYNPNKFTHRSQMDHTVSTQAWVMAEAPTRRFWRHARP
jgi:membrane protease YdiL (CAAX protease family)